jgi:hypothetical protein
MKVKVLASFNHPQTGKTYPAGTVLELDAKYLNTDYLEEVKPKKKKTTKKDK